MLGGADSRECRAVASDGESTSFITEQSTQSASGRVLHRRRWGRVKATLLGLAGLLALIVALRAALPSPCKGRELSDFSASSPTELLEVNVEVPADRRRAADERARAIVSVLNDKPQHEASLLVRKAMERAGNETLARRRALQATNAQFNEILRKAEGMCFVVSTVPDSKGGKTLSVDVKTSKISLADSNGKYQQMRIFNAGADNVYSITAVNVPPRGAFVQHKQNPLRVLMGKTGQDQSWKIIPVPGQADAYTIQAVMPNPQRGRLLLSHDRSGLVSLEQVVGQSQPRQRWNVACVEQSPGRKKQREATCAFNIIYATQYLARSSFLIQGAAKTCPNSKGLLLKICALNALAASASLANIALSISNAASSCAETTNVHALCASGVEALIVSLSTLGAGGLVTAVGCQPGLTAADLHLPPGATPATLGGPGYLGRRLFLGGGIENFLAQCILDFTQVAWSLGSVGIAIAAAARDSCPPSGTGLLHELTQSACAMDVGAVLYAFGRIAVFLALAVIHCTNELNIQALCAAGISAVVASAAALIVTGNAFFIACEKGIPFVKSGGLVPEMVGASAEAGATRRLTAQSLTDAMKGKDLHKLVESYGYNVSDPLHLPSFDNVDSALKVLQSFDELQAEQLGVGKASLARRFGSPEQMWQHLGFNTSQVPEAPKQGHESERFVRLMEPVLSKDDLDKVAAAAAPQASQMWSLPLTKSTCA